MTQKQRKMISLENLAPELQDLLKSKYPNGFLGHTTKIDTPKETVNVVNLETSDTVYLVKVKLDIKKSKHVDDDDDDDDFVPEEGGIGSEKDEFDSDDSDDDDSYDDKADDDGGEDDDDDED